MATYVRTFENVSPPKRDDNRAWTKVNIRENAVQTFASSTVIETKTLSPVDTNPLDPLPRSFTTALATIGQNGFYWLVWEDALGAQYISAPIQNTTALTTIELLVRSEFPKTWDGLQADAYLGLAVLRLRIENVKAAILPAVYAVADEASFPNVLRAYISKRCALDLIPTGIEYWMRQKTSMSTTGTNETKTLTDPILALRELAKRLAVEAETLASNPDIMIYAQTKGEAPGLSWGGAPVTPNPFEFDPPFNTDETVGYDIAS